MYMGLNLLPANCSQVLSDFIRPKFEDMESKGVLSSFTAVYSSSEVEIPVGIDINLQVSGDDKIQSLNNTHTENSSRLPSSKISPTIPSTILPLLISGLVLAIIVMTLAVPCIVKKSCNHLNSLEGTESDFEDGKDLKRKVSKYLPQVLLVPGKRLKADSIIGEGERPGIGSSQ
jgi:hypothetical protein